MIKYGNLTAYEHSKQLLESEGYIVDEDGQYELSEELRKEHTLTQGGYIM